MPDDVNPETDAIDSVGLTAEIVSAYVSNNAISPADLPRLMADVHTAIAGLAQQDATAAVSAEKPKPAVPIRRSVTPDYIICLEDGKKFKSLKRHLQTHHNMTPDEYRARWGLPLDYPMVAPSYAEQRSKLAKKIGLGKKG